MGLACFGETKEGQSTILIIQKDLQKKSTVYPTVAAVDHNYQAVAIIQKDVQKKSAVKIIVVAVDGQEYEIQVSINLTGYQLKQYIFKNVCQSLSPSQMHINYAGVKIQNDKSLSKYKIAERGTQLKVVQTKLPLSEVASIILAYEDDPITLEKQTTRMPCGHVVGRNCMTMYVRSLLSANMYEIKCPSSKPNGEDCENQWEYQLCRKIGGFTAQECAEFEEGLSKNWIAKFTVQCPSCNISLVKENQSAPIVCPKCKYGPFCPICLKKWISTTTDYCGNMECKMMNKFLLDSPWTVELALGGNIYKLPQHRVCVTCSVPIEHNKGCKHMQCTACKSQFCWVCLQMPKGKLYPCKGTFDYCGFIAPPQTIK